MITWASDLYVSESAKDREKKIITGIRRHKLQFGVYVIALSANGRDLLDLIPSYMLSENSYKGRDIRILGLAVGKEDARELAASMIMDVYEQTGDFDVRGHFS